MTAPEKAPETARDGSGAEARRIAGRVLEEVATGARTNAALNRALTHSDLDERDRAFATELANGTVRMQRSCDHFIDRLVSRDPDATVRALLRIGVYQLVFLATPPHAAVSATVAAAAPKVRGFINAVLRRVAEDVERGGDWPTVGVELSYPDWLIDRAIEELGEADGLDALAAMNVPEQPRARPDGYVQGAASMAVVAEVGATAGDVVLDLCAAPGGKTTGMAADGATVYGLEIGQERVALLADFCERYGADRAAAVRGDATANPFRTEAADHVLVDAPCSGWGALGRRSDARWRVRSDDARRLSAIQIDILRDARRLVRPGGTLVYSVCTFTEIETLAVAKRFRSESPDFEPIGLRHPDHWRPLGTGGIVLPQDHESDAMAVFRWRRRDPMATAGTDIS